MKKTTTVLNFEKDHDDYQTTVWVTIENLFSLKYSFEFEDAVKAEGYSLNALLYETIRETFNNEETATLLTDNFVAKLRKLQRDLSEKTEDSCCGGRCGCE